MNLSSKTVFIPSIVLLIGTVFGTSATNAFADDPFKNKVDIQIGDNTNSCDEKDNGDNTAICKVKDKTTVSGVSVEGEKNKIKLETGDNKNDCDESGDGNNIADCEIDSTKNIGPIIITAP